MLIGNSQLTSRGTKKVGAELRYATLSHVTLVAARRPGSVRGMHFPLGGVWGTLPRIAFTMTGCLSFYAIYWNHWTAASKALSSGCSAASFVHVWNTGHPMANNSLAVIAPATVVPVFGCEALP